MTNSVLLIHIYAAESAALADLLVGPQSLPGVDGNSLLNAFCDRLSNYKEIFLCAENDQLRHALEKRLPHAKNLSWQPEIAAVRAVFADKARTHIALANGVYPLLDLTVTQKLHGIHVEYRADISYAENMPPGMALNFVSRDLLESLDIMEAKDGDLSSGIRPFVEKNINQFHAEVHYEEPDLRLLRLDFSLASRRSLVKTAAFLNKLSETPTPQALENPYAQLQEVLQASPELLHTFPSYIEIEFSVSAEAKSYFSPLSVIEQSAAKLSRPHFQKILEYIATGYGDTSVCASGLGEPLEHPEAVDFLREILEEQSTRYVFVEANGIHLEKLRPLASHASAGKLRIIVMLNSLERYEELSGSPKASLAAVKKSIQSLAADLNAAGKNAAEMIYLQALKVEENEAEIDSLYALAEELGISFLLQKYNRYAGLLPERRVSDMTPLERYSCWHLRRDLFIRANGDVAFCKQTVDPKKPTARGNLSKDLLADIWAGQKADFVLNYQGKYPVHLPCANCDEYFTFNY